MATQMNIQDCTALGARKAFTLRPYKHFACGGGVFLVVLLSGVFFYPLIAIIVAGIFAGGVYFYLESRLLVIECPSCGRDINTNTPWQCGFKGCRNENADEFPFIHECEHCHYPPKAYVCHHRECGQLIYLTSDRQQIHAAKCLTAPEPVKVIVKTKVIVKDVVGDKIATQREEVRDKEHQLKLTTLDKKIDIVKKMPSEATPVDWAPMN